MLTSFSAAICAKAEIGRPAEKVQLRRRERPVESGAHEEVANVRVGLEQDLRGKQDVVDANDTLFVQLHVVDERAPAVQREVQRVVQIVIEVRAGADDEIDEAAIHQLDDAAAETGRRHRARHREADRGVVLGQEHLVCENPARFAKARRVERLKPLLNQMPDIGAAARPVVANRFARQIVGALLARRARSSVGHVA